MKVALFLGPTLALTEARSLLDATYLPPAGQGDIYRIVRDRRPQIIGIIDGYFQQVAAVWHREILFALSEGVHVFGAASMGALRAAELQPFGMQGVGAIFEAYRDGAYPSYAPPFERDEEVAVEHGPPETGYLALTDALVDMRATLSEALRAGVLGEAARARLIGIASDIHFADRTFQGVFEAAAKAQIEDLDCARLEQWTIVNKISQKANDARLMLATIGRFAEGKVEPFRPTFRFESALVWERFRDACDRSDEAGASELDERVLDELRLDPAAFAKLAGEARLHYAVFRPGAGERTLSPSEERVGLDALRARHALARRADLDAWMNANAIDETTMRRLIAWEAAIARLATAPARALLDVARAAGLVAPAHSRALDKAHCLETVPEARREPTALEGAALTAWWIEDRRVEGADVSRLAQSLGFDGEQALVSALWRERLYLRCKGWNS